jgi:hypothetical protein
MEKTVYKNDAGSLKQMTADEIGALDGALGDRLFQITQKLNLVQTIETVNL